MTEGAKNQATLRRIPRLILFFLVLVVLLEAGSRWLLIPYLNRVAWSAEDASHQLKAGAAQYDLIAIGDSFVQTGQRGWIHVLQKKGRKVLNLGIGGACPSMYYRMFNEIEPYLTPSQKVLILIYIGNDFMDEAIWQRVKFKREYPVVRDDIYFQSNLVHWPYAQNNTSSWYEKELKSRSALLKVLGFVKFGIKSRLGHSKSSPSTKRALDRYIEIYANNPDFERQNRLLEEFLEQNIVQSSDILRTNNRIFFLKHHNVTAYEASEETREAGNRILEMAKKLSLHKNVFLVPILAREEIGIKFHREQIRRNAVFLEKLKAANSNVIDTNPLFVKVYPETNLYLPDGHWNLEGHHLFAEALSEHFSAGLER